MSTNPIPTSLTLLERARQGDSEAWNAIAELYAPLVYRWLRKYRLQEVDVEDVLQQVFTTVSYSITEFRREPDSGSFRGWLFSITRSRVMDLIRRREKEPVGRGGSTAHHDIEQVSSELSSIQDLREETASLYQRALKLIQSDFSDRVVQAFFRHAVDGVPASDVAEELDMTRDAVYAAKKRILKRLREELTGLL